MYMPTFMRNYRSTDACVITCIHTCIVAVHHTAFYSLFHPIVSHSALPHFTTFLDIMSHNNASHSITMHHAHTCLCIRTCAFPQATEWIDCWQERSRDRSRRQGKRNTRNLFTYFAYVSMFLSQYVQAYLPDLLSNWPTHLLLCWLTEELTNQPAQLHCVRCISCIAENTSHSHDACTCIHESIYFLNMFEHVLQMQVRDKWETSVESQGPQHHQRTVVPCRVLVLQLDTSRFTAHCSLHWPRC
jgi:hypothetical protein